MTDSQIAGMALAALLLITIAVAGLVIVIRRLRRTRAARQATKERHPSGSRLAVGLEHPVHVPPRHPERFPQLDVHDQELAELHDELWPEEEYLAVLDCPRDVLTRYATQHDAEQATDRARRSRIRACRCGGFHIHYRRSRAARRTRR